MPPTALCQPCDPSPAGSRLLLPAAAKPPPPAMAMPVAPQPPAPLFKVTISSLSSAHCLCNNPFPPNCSPQYCCHPWTLVRTSWMWLPRATFSSGSPCSVGQGWCCPLSIMLGGAPPASPALLLLSLVPAAPRAPILALCHSPPHTRGLRHRAGTSCWCWAGDTQLQLLPICHPQGHLPLTSYSSAERHHDENPPTGQKAWLNAVAWQK